jgi:hypothetical protein
MIEHLIGLLKGVNARKDEKRVKGLLKTSLLGLFNQFIVNFFVF